MQNVTSFDFEVSANENALIVLSPSHELVEGEMYEISKFAWIIATGIILKPKQESLEENKQFTTYPLQIREEEYTGTCQSPTPLPPPPLPNLAP